MPYLCENCGNEDTFEAIQDLRVWEREKVYINGDGDIEDYGDSDTVDSEVEEGPYDIECSECGCAATWYDDYDDIEEFQNNRLREQQEEKSPMKWKEEIQR